MAVGDTLLVRLAEERLMHALRGMHCEMHYFQSFAFENVLGEFVMNQLAILQCRFCVTDGKFDALIAT